MNNIKRHPFPIICFTSLLVIAFLLTGYFDRSSQKVFAKATSPSITKSLVMDAGESKPISIKTNGYIIKSVSLKTSDESVCVAKKKSKKTISVTALTPGEATITLTIKTKKGKNKKTFKLKTRIIVNNKTIGPITVEIIDGNDIILYFDRQVSYYTILHIKIVDTSTLSPVVFVGDGIEILPDGKSCRISLNAPGLTPDTVYRVSSEELELSTEFSFYRSTPKLEFISGKKKTMKNVSFVPGAKIGSFPLKANNYNLTPTYSLEGFNAPMFDVDENGILYWRTDAVLSKRKKLLVTIVVSTEVTDLYTPASAKLELTIYPKK